MDAGPVTARGLLRLPRRILFGRQATRAIGAAVHELGSSALICTDETIAETPTAENLLGSLDSVGVQAQVFDRCRADLPLSCVEEGRAFAQEHPFDLVIGFGGGSCIDLAKALAVLQDHPGELDRYYGEDHVERDLLPIVAVPTTAGTGSEVSPVAVISDPSYELKVGISSPKLIPSIAICDPQATLSCPPSLTAMAGIDALIHAVEAYCAPERENPWSAYPGDVFRGRDVLSRHYALQATELIAAALESAVDDGSDLAAREAMMLGSLWAGIAFAHQGTASAHALQYPIGAATGTPHGMGVGLLAPYTLAAARPAVDQDLRALAGALGVDHRPEAAIAEIERLGHAVGVPRSLSALGVARERLPDFAAQAAGIARLVRNSPRPMLVGDLLGVLEAAWLGDLDQLARSQKAERP
jgi:alcohol dehydrogenase